MTAGDFTIAIRVDSGYQIGSGHVMRCLNLARELRRRGEKPAFFCRPHAGHLNQRIAEEFPLHQLKTSPALSDASSHADWLGATEQEDAAELISYLTANTKLKGIIADHYGSGQQWAEALRPCARKILQIDDLADRQHSADLVLDENLWPEDQDYKDLIAPHTRTLLGPSYALLGEGFDLAHQSALARSQAPVQRLLVFFGSMDVTNECEKFLLAAAEKPDVWRGLDITVLLGPGNEQAGDLQARFAHLPLNLMVSTDDMIGLLAQQDYVLGALGFSIWERFCLGINSSIVSVAHNQVAVSERLASADLIDYLGLHQMLGQAAYADFLQRLANSNIQVLEQRRQRLMKLVDGRGCARVADLLLSEV